MIQNKSLQFKLIGSFCIVSVMIALVAWSGFYGSNTAVRVANDMAQTQIPQVMSLGAMHQVATELRMQFYAIINSSYPAADRPKMQANFDALWAALDENWKVYDQAERTSDEEVEWAEIQKLRAAMKADYERFEKLYQSYARAASPAEVEQTRTRLTDFYFASLRGSSKDFINKLGDSFRTVGKDAKETGVISRKDALTARSLATAFGIAGILLSLAFGIIMSLNTSKRLRLIAVSAGDGADQISSASSQVSSASQNVAQGSQEQAASIEETGSSLEEMAAMTKQNADNSKSAAALMREAKAAIDKAAGGAANMAMAMNDIKAASDQTSKIIKTIDEIAFQTNLLALNAAVEAARAGEAGKGFAVVAEEVRNLSIRAAEAAKNTGSLIEENVNRVAGGVQIIVGLKSSLDDVAMSSDKVSGIVHEVAAASDEQAKGIDQINLAVTQMNSVTQQNAASAEESASAAEEMAAQAAALQESVRTLLQIVDGGRT